MACACTVKTVGDGHGGAMHERNAPVPHTGVALDAAERLEGAAAPPVHVAVGSMGPVHLGGQGSGVRGDRRVGLGGAAEHVATALVGLDEIGAAGDGEVDAAGAIEGHRGEVLVARHGLERLEEATRVAILLREVEREAESGPLEPAVYVAMTHG